MIRPAPQLLADSSPSLYTSGSSGLGFVVVLNSVSGTIWLSTYLMPVKPDLPSASDDTGGMALHSDGEEIKPPSGVGQTGLIDAMLRMPLETGQD